MGFGIFFVPLVGGYLFLKYCHYTRFSIRRESGHKLVLESAVVGLVLLAVARLVTLVVSTLTSAGLERTIDDAGNTMGLLFVESMASDSTVELSLINGKVYVGWILNANVAEPERKFVDLLPLASGYLATETHEVTFTTSLPANSRPSAFGVHTPSDRRT